MKDLAAFPQPERIDVDALLNVAATCLGTRTLGPGLRAVVWVQGCPIHCPGCIAPDWIPLRPARLVAPEQLVGELLRLPGVTGLTFSGGEPMLQAGGLARLARLARQERELSILCFTGYRLEILEKTPPVPGVRDLLDQVDVLIDGPYIERMNDNRGLRGSLNQRIHYFTDRLSEFDLAGEVRKAEIKVQDGQVMMVGVPPAGLEKAFRQALDTASQRQWEMLNERI